MNNEYLEIAKNLKIVPGFARKLTRDFKPKTKIALKKNEVRTLIELLVNPNQPMSFYLNSIEMEKGSFTYVTDKLEDKGLVKKINCPEDKRRTTLTLTDYGYELASDIRNQFHKHLVNTISKLSKDDIKNLKNASELLIKVFDKI